MKILTGIDTPAPGEHALAVTPPLSPYTRATANGPAVRSRMNLFAQRALTHLALTAEQRARMGDTALLAQAVAPGVIDGFEVALEGAQLVVMPGHAIAPSGEDVELASSRRLSPESVLLEPTGLAARCSDSSADKAIAARIAGGDRLTLADLRALGRLDLLPHALVLVAQPLSIAIDQTGDVDTPCQNSVGEGAFSALAWEDGFQLVWVPWPVDFPIPAWTSDGTTLDTRFRNRLAWTIFNFERIQPIAPGVRSVRAWLAPPSPPTRRARHQRVVWPWDGVGAPLALVGFDGSFSPVFSDRSAVVRQGGGRRNRSPLVAASGDDTLWQARVAQLLEHLAELPPDQRLAARLAQQFDFLPPAGVLPVDLVDFEGHRQLLFPPSYDVVAQPVPLDMVDALIAESSPLKPYSLSVPDQVQLLVPVPARYFDPDLLQLDERIHPLFDLEVARLEGDRLALLTQRDGLRRRFDTLAHAVGGELPAYPQDDENALPDETGALDGLAFARIRRVDVGAGAAPNWHGFRNSHVRLKLGASDALVAFVRIDAPVAALGLRITLGTATTAFVWGAIAMQPGGQVVGGLPALGEWTRLVVPISLAPAFAGVEIDNIEFGVLAGAVPGQVRWGYAGKLAQGLESYWLSDATPHHAEMTGTWLWQTQGTEFKAADDVTLGLPVSSAGVRQIAEVDSLIASYESYAGGALKVELGEGPQSPDKPNPRLANSGFSELIQRLQLRINAAGDHLEFGFLRARTDVFRVRQSVLGTEDAGRFLTSPAAAELIKRNENPIGTEKDFADYFQRAATTLISGPGATIVEADAAPRLLLAPMRILMAATPVSAVSGMTAFRPTAKAILDIGSAPGAPRSKSPELAEDVVTARATGSIRAQRAIAGDIGSVGIISKPLQTTVSDVAGASLLGATLNTVTVGERLASPAAIVTSNAAAKGKSDFVSGGIGLLKEAGLAIDDLQVFGFKATDAGAGSPPVAVKIGDLADGSFIDADAQDVAGVDLHESVYFKRSVDAIDNMVRFLRGVEIRTEDYRRLQADATAARDRVLTIARQIQVWLGGLAGRLAEVRHDLSVTRSLRAEEQTRVAALVARRRAILAEQVPYLVFRRPRMSRTLVDVPVLAVQPATVADPVPRCRAESHDVPLEIRQMVDTLKDVPARWFKRIPALISKFDRIDYLQTLVTVTRQRLDTNAMASKLVAFDGDETTTGRLLKGAFDQHEARVAKTVQTASQQFALAKTDTWKNAIDSIQHVVSIGDLVRANPPAMDVTLQAAGELDDIAGVASCLHAAFSRVPPVVRLRWAELFSELDPATSLRTLTVLPRFGDESVGVDYIEWRQMQIMVDWLFSCVAADDDAVAAINDLVRVCLLLASHAPVDRILSARIRRPVPPVVNGRLDLEFDPKIARIGMQVLVHAPATKTIVARAVIDDIGESGGIARITQVLSPSATIDATMRVQLQSGAALSTPGAAKADQAKAVPAAGQVATSQGASPDRAAPVAKGIAQMLAVRGLK